MMRPHRVNSSLSSSAAAAAAVAAVAGPGVEHMDRALSPWMLDVAEGAALRATTVYLHAMCTRERAGQCGGWCALGARGKKPVPGWVLFDCELGEEVGYDGWLAREKTVDWYCAGFAQLVILECHVLTRFNLEK